MEHPMTRGLPFPAISGSSPFLSKRGILKLSAALWVCLPFSAMGQTVLPQGGNVASGAATIVRPNGSTVVINQGSNNAVVNWDSFSIGNGGHVDIRQPGSNSAILNRVTGTTTSEIHGRLTANGTVHLVNPNGIFIGPTGTVNAGSFSASTLDISNDDFNAGRLRYSGNGNSALVENAGRITIGRGGYAALIGGKIKNSGTVVVPYGRIGFAAGEQVVLDVSGDQFLQVAIPSNGEDDGDALITNSGTASAEAGLIEMRAATARNAARHAINLSGVAEASSVAVRGGTIVLGGGAGGAVTVSGKVSTRAKPAAIIVTESKRPPVRGGDITITGQNVALNGADIDASGDNGGGLIRIGGDFAGAGDLDRADTVYVDQASFIRSDAISDGDGGRVVLWSDVFTEFAGNISAQGGEDSGNGGFVEVSSARDLRYSGLSDTRAANGEWGTTLLDPLDILVGDDTVRPGNSGLSETIAAATVVANLNAGNFELNTDDFGGSSGSEDGDIIISEDIVWTSGTRLTLDAEDEIFISANITNASGQLTLDANGSSTDSVQVQDGFSLTVNELDFEDGDWRETDGNLTPLNVTNFILGFNADFVRANGGDGSAGNPFQLTDVFGLQGMASQSLTGTSYILANDIDASATQNWSDGSSSGFIPVDNFSGNFDGDLHTISNITTNTNNGEGFNDGGSLFDVLDSGAVVSDLILTNVSVSAADTGGLASTNNGTIRNILISGTVNAEGSSAGGLVALNNGTIQDSGADVTVNATLGAGSSGDQTAGGFVGTNNGTINRSHALGNVNASNPSDTFFDVHVGGFAGLEAGFSMTITDSYSQGNVSLNSVPGTGARNIGGFIGSVRGTIQRSYSSGSVSASGSDTSAFNLGGFAGEDSGGSGSGTNFFDVNRAGLSTSPFGTGLTTAQFQDTETFISVASAQGWDFANIWAPGDTGFDPVNYSTTAVILATPNPVTVEFGQTGSATTTGTVNGGPSSFVFARPGESLDTSGIFNNLSFNGFAVGNQTFGLTQTSVNSSIGRSFRIVDRTGSATITPATPTTEIPVPPIFIGFPLPNPTDNIDDGTDSGDDTAVLSPGGTLGEAENTLAAVEGVAGALNIAADSCGQSSGDVTRYLACLADALDDFADELDDISADLPPGMQNVARIVQDARVQIDQARSRAAQRLSTATTDAQRQAIRQDAANEARAALATASSEIRKSIALVRADDPELANVQRATVTTVANAVDNVGITLTRAIGL